MEVSGLHAIHEEGVLVFAGIAEDAAFSDNHVSADVHSRANFRPGSYIRGSLDAAVGREDGGGVDKDVGPDEQVGRFVWMLLCFRKIERAQRLLN